MNFDITFSPSAVVNCNAPDRSLPGRRTEALQDAWPTTVDVVAQRGARFRSHLLELAMLKFDQGRVGAFDREAHLDLGADGRIGLPMAVDVPADDEALRRIPEENLADGGLRAVLAGLVPASAKTRLDRHGLQRRSADRSLARPPTVKPRREHFEGTRLARLDADALANGRDGHGLIHGDWLIHDDLPFS